MKVVINRCYGGFGLSHEAVMRYFEIKGITVYPEQDSSIGSWKFWTYWLVKPEDRIESKEGEAFYAMSMEDRRAYNKAHSEQTVYPREIERHDPVLVQVVEEMGDKANGAHAELKVVQIPDDVNYIIEEYDGLEHIAEEHRTWG
jgi:hypothetical protein